MMSDEAAARIKALAQKHAELAISTLVEVMEDDQAKEAARVKAADIILQRGFGAPERKVETKVDVTIVDQRRAHLDALRRLSTPKALPAPETPKPDVIDADWTEIKPEKKK